MKTLSVTPRPWYRWKAEYLRFLHVLLVRGVTLTSLLIKKRQSWALVLSILFDRMIKKRVDLPITVTYSVALSRYSHGVYHFWSTSFFYIRLLKPLLHYLKIC